LPEISRLFVGIVINLAYKLVNCSRFLSINPFEPNICLNMFNQQCCDLDYFLSYI
jgi:hypothetical protein